MSIDTSLSVSLGNSIQTADARARDLCRLARAAEEAGDYERAEAALAEFWDGVGTEPRVGKLGDVDAADVLLRAGSITRRVSRSGLTMDVQELAKNLLTRSLRTYERLSLPERAAEAQSELAYCYWRKGEHDNARVLLSEAIARLPDSDTKAEALLRSAVVEKSAGRTREALEILSSASALFEKSRSHALKGWFHMEKATFLKNLGEAEGGDELTDSALLEYAAASHHFEEAGHRRNLGLVENQTGFLLLRKKRFEDAHEHLSRARRVFVGLDDYFRAAQVDDTRAQVFIEEEKYADAMKTAMAAVRVLEGGDTYALLAEALVTLGRAQARGGEQDRSRQSLYRALEVAKLTGDANLIATSTVVAITELLGGGRLDELMNLYVQAAELVAYTNDRNIKSQLDACAGALVKALRDATVATEATGSEAAMSSNDRASWDGFSLTRMLRGIESEYINRALQEASGSVSKAATLLGYKHSESLNSRIKKLGLQAARTPIKSRRRSIIPKEFKRQSRKQTKPQTT